MGIITRTTKETNIQVELKMGEAGDVNINTTLPFLDHMLTAMAFHGDFSLNVQATGDTEVDFHHLIEDIGLVLGDALKEWEDQQDSLQRYGSMVIPMDEALSEVVIDVCNRPTLVYNAEFPQSHVGNFELYLFHEFFIALSNRAAIALHLNCRYGKNSHHMIECLFKALGKSLKIAYTPRKKGQSVLSTKGSL